MCLPYKITILMDFDKEKVVNAQIPYLHSCMIFLEFDANGVKFHCILRLLTY